MDGRSNGFVSRTRRWALAALALSLLLSSRARADLSSDVTAILKDPELAHAKIAVQVVKLEATREQDHVVFEQGAQTLLIPASNQKLVTTACAIETLGPDFEFQTVLVKRDDGTLALIGDGDPALGDGEYVKFSGAKAARSTSIFESWAAALKQQGTTKFSDLLVDDSVFDEELFSPNWPVDQANFAYVSEVSGLTFNANCLDVYLIAGSPVEIRTDPSIGSFLKIVNSVTMGSTHAVSLLRKSGTNQISIRGVINASNTKTPLRVTIHDPALFAGNALKNSFVTSGLTIGGEVKRDRTIRAAMLQENSGWTVLAINKSPLLDVIRFTNKESKNLYAECLLRRTTFAKTGHPGGRAEGATVLKEFIAKTGAPPDSMQPDDGSGLSKTNRISPQAFCSVLAYMFHGEHKDAFIGTLAVGGVDGTLGERFNGLLKGRVFAKSGFVNGVRTLSGYLKTKNDQWYAFSILVNDVPSGGSAKAKQLHERIVEAIDQNAGQ